MSLEDIQLDIVVTLQGQQNIRSAVRSLNDIATATSKVRQRSLELRPVTLKEARTWDGLTEALGRVERKYDAVFRAGAHMSMMGQGLLDTSERIARATLGIVDKYEDYDTMLRRGAVALNVNETWQGKLDEAIQKTSQSIGLLKPEEVAEGYYIWGAAAGMVVDTQEELDSITRVVQDTMIATAMAGGTLEGNLNGVFGVLSQFNLPMSRAADVTHTLALMTERTAAQFPDLINSLSYIGPLAESLGIKFEDVTSILGLLADAGQKGSRAGRGLAMVIEGMSAPSGPAGEALDGLIQRTHGLSAAWEDVIFPEGQYVGMRDMLIEMAQAAEGMTDAERGRFYATAFTNNATRALIPLIEDQIDLNREAAESGREVTSVLDQQKYATEGAGEFFEVMKEKALGSITAIKGRLTASFFPILQDLAVNILEMGQPVIKWLTDIADRVADFVDANPELVQFAIKIVAITTAAMAAAGILFTLGGSIMYLIGNLGVFVQGIGRILAPFGLLIGLLVGFGVAIYNNVGGIRDSIANFASAAAELFGAITGDGTAFSRAWKEVWDTVLAAGEWVIERIADVLDHLAGVMRELSQNKQFTDFMGTVLDIFLRFRVVIGILVGAGATFWAAGRAISFFTGALKILTGYAMAKSVILGIAGAIRTVASAFGILKAVTVAGGIPAGLTAIRVALGLLMGPVGWILTAVGVLAVAWETNFLGIRDIIANVVNWFVNVAWPAVQGFFTGLVDGVVGAFNTVVEFFANLPTRVGEFLTMVWEAITGWVTSVFTTIGEFVTTVTTAIGDFLADIAENWDYYLGFVIGLIIGFAARGLIEIWNFMSTLVKNIVEWISKAPGRFAEWLGKTWTTVSTWFTQTLIPNVWNFMSTLISNIVTWISKAPGKFMTWLGEVWNRVSKWFGQFLKDAGEWTGDVVANIVKFFKELPGKAVDAIREIVPKFIDFLGSIPGRLVRILGDVGRGIVNGVWKGIQGAWNSFWNSVHDFFSGIVDGVKHALGIQSPSKVFAEIGDYMIQGLTAGISGNDSAKRALAGYAGALTGIASATSIGFSAGIDGLDDLTGGTITSDATRVLRIELDLSSSDGSYSDATLEQLKAALTGSDFVRALEHMAETD